MTKRNYLRISVNLLFVTIAWPESGKRNLYTDLIHQFRDEGHQVTVVASRPRRNKLPSSFKEEEGVSVLRIKTGNISKTNPLEKSISLFLLNLQFKRGINKYLKGKSFDLILFNTPPITLSGLLKTLKHKYQCPLYVLLKDIWPYGFSDFGLIKKGGWVYNYFRRHEKKLYNLADFIGCMSPKGVKFLLEKHPELDSEKVEVCPNSIKVNGIQQTKNHSIREKFDIPKEATVFIFSGNLGLGHGLDFISDAILELRNYNKAFFLIGGAGTYFSKMKQVFDKENPPNAMLYSYLPEKDYEELISTCEVGLILLDNIYTYPQFPSRLLSYLENRMAVLCAVNKETDIGVIVEENGAGINTLHGDMTEFIDAVKILSEDTSSTKQMGENGYMLLKDKYTVQKSYSAIIKHFV